MHEQSLILLGEMNFRPICILDGKKNNNISTAIVCVFSAFNSGMFDLEARVTFKPKSIDRSMGSFECASAIKLAGPAPTQPAR